MNANFTCRSAALLYFILMAYVVLGVLREVRPLCKLFLFILMDSFVTVVVQGIISSQRPCLFYLNWIISCCQR